MKITREIIQAILDRREKGLTYGEIGRTINMTSQNVGRFMSGQVRSINDASGEALLVLLGLKEAQPETAGLLFEVICDTPYMEPTIAQGQRVFARCTHPNDISNGDLIVASYTDSQNRDKIVCRYFAKSTRTVTLTCEQNKGRNINTTIGRLNWVAKVFFPTRTLTAK
jgi:hypothetical protein